MINAKHYEQTLHTQLTPEQRKHLNISMHGALKREALNAENAISLGLNKT